MGWYFYQVRHPGKPDENSASRYDSGGGEIVAAAAVFDDGPESVKIDVGDKEIDVKVSFERRSAGAMVGRLFVVDDVGRIFVVDDDAVDTRRCSLFWPPRSFSRGNHLPTFDCFHQAPCSYLKMPSPMKTSPPCDL